MKHQINETELYQLDSPQYANILSPSEKPFDRHSKKQALGMKNPYTGQALAIAAQLLLRPQACLAPSSPQPRTLTPARPPGTAGDLKGKDDESTEGAADDNG